MRVVFVLVLACMSFNFLNAQEINQKAKKYLDILSNNLLLKVNLQKRLIKIDDTIASAKQLVVATKNKAKHVIVLADLYQPKGDIKGAIAVLKKASFENEEEKEIKVKLVDSYMHISNVLRLTFFVYLNFRLHINGSAKNPARTQSPKTLAVIVTDTVHRAKL